MKLNLTLVDSILLKNSVDAAIQKVKNHPRVKLIRHNIELSDTFNFDSVSLDDILTEVTGLNIAKNGILKNISTLCLKEVSDICNPEVF